MPMTKTTAKLARSLMKIDENVWNEGALEEQWFRDHANIPAIELCIERRMENESKY
jgi:hypothetical protein